MLLQYCYSSYGLRGLSDGKTINFINVTNYDDVIWKYGRLQLNKLLPNDDGRTYSFCQEDSYFLQNSVLSDFLYFITINYDPSRA